MPLLTPEFRVSYPSVFKPRPKDPKNPSSELVYSVEALFPKGADLTALKQAVQAAVVEKWGPDKTKWPTNLRSPFRDQADKRKVDEKTGKSYLPPGCEEGAIFLKLWSKNRPGVVDQKVKDIDPAQFYAGCWAKASVNIYTYDKNGSRGVNIGLGNIQKTRDGEPLGGRTLPQNDFAPVADAAAASGGGAGDLFA